MNPDHPTIVAASTWGTGYGNTRHLIGTTNIYGTTWSRCRRGEYPLSYFDADTEKRYGNPHPQGVYVARKKHCKACAKLAAADQPEGTTPVKILNPGQRAVADAVKRLEYPTGREVAEHLGISRSTAQTRLMALLRHGVIRQVGIAPTGAMTFTPIEEDTK